MQDPIIERRRSYDQMIGELLAEVRHIKDALQQTQEKLDEIQGRMNVIDDMRSQGKGALLILGALFVFIGYLANHLFDRIFPPT
jgi:hypothetical protein